MLKKLILYSLIFPICLAKAQTAPILAGQDLEIIYKAELGLALANAGAEWPITPNLLVDLGAGLGPRYDMQDDMRMSGGEDNTLFLRGQVRFYLNRAQREANGHSLRSNSGLFLAFQTKFLPIKDESKSYQSPTN